MAATANPEARLFLGKVPREVTSEDLTEHFSAFGEVVDVFTPRAHADAMFRICFVSFSHPSAATDALKQVTHNIKGKDINVTKALPRESRPPPPVHHHSYAAPVAEDQARAYVNGLPPGAEDSAVKEYFSQFGVVADVFQPGYKGFGFVTFADRKGLYKCLAQDKHDFGGNAISVSEARPRPTRPPDPYTHGGSSSYYYDRPPLPPAPSAPLAHEVNRVWVQGLPSDITENQLDEYFSQFGAVSKVVIPASAQTRDVKFAFITFADAEGMQKTLQHPTHMLSNHATPLRVVVARPRSSAPPPRAYDRAPPYAYPPPRAHARAPPPRRVAYAADPYAPAYGDPHAASYAPRAYATLPPPSAYSYPPTSSRTASYASSAYPYAYAQPVAAVSQSATGVSATPYAQVPTPDPYYGTTPATATSTQPQQTHPLQTDYQAVQSHAHDSRAQRRWAPY